MRAFIVAGLLLQPDIGQTALVLATWAGLLFLSGISWFIIFGLLFQHLFYISLSIFVSALFQQQLSTF